MKTKIHTKLFAFALATLFLFTGCQSEPDAGTVESNSPVEQESKMKKIELTEKNLENYIVYNCKYHFTGEQGLTDQGFVYKYYDISIAVHSRNTNYQFEDAVVVFGLNKRKVVLDNAGEGIYDNTEWLLSGAKYNFDFHIYSVSGYVLIPE